MKHLACCWGCGSRVAFSSQHIEFEDGIGATLLAQATVQNTLATTATWTASCDIRFFYTLCSLLEKQSLPSSRQARRVNLPGLLASCGWTWSSLEELRSRWRRDRGRRAWGAANGFNCVCWRSDVQTLTQSQAWSSSPLKVRP